MNRRAAADKLVLRALLAGRLSCLRREDKFSWLTDALGSPPER